MADDNAQYLAARFAELGLEEESKKILAGAKSQSSVEETVPSSAKSTSKKISHVRKDSHSETPSSSTKQTVENSTAGHGTSRSRRIPRTRADSPTESGNAASTPAEPQPNLALSQLDILALQNDNKKLMEAASQFKGRLDNQIKKMDQLCGELNRVKEELRSCKEQLEISKRENEYLRNVDSEDQMKLDGRFFKGKDDIRFERKPFSGEDTELIFSRIFKFPKRVWVDSWGFHCEEDKCTIAFVKLSGHWYSSKSGKNTGDYGDFIDSDHWTNEAMVLSKKAGLPLEKGLATHAEPKLIAFYITRLMEASGFKMNDIDNPKAHDACHRFGGLVTIHISKEVCKSCKAFVEKINHITSSFGLRFDPQNKLRPYRPEPVPDTSEGIDVTFVD